MEAILHAAEALLVENGSGGLSTNAIARRAGVNIATLYGYFPDKHAVLAELVGRFEDRRTRFLRARMDALAGPRWREVLSETVDAMADFREREPAAMLLRRAVRAEPELRPLDDESADVVATTAGSVIRRRAPALTQADAERIARVAVMSLTEVLDDAFSRSPRPDRRVVEEGKRMVAGYLATYLDGDGARA